MTGLRPAPRSDALERIYWTHIARQELRLQCCAACHSYRYPPAPVCPDCGGTAADWRALSGTGEVVAWTVFHRSYFPGLPAPYAVVSVRTAEGPLLVGNLTGPAPPAVGLAVRAVFCPARFEDGTEGRICQWAPADPALSSPEGVSP